MPTVNAEKIARALNLTESRVHQLVKEGLPKEARGQYDPVKCMVWYVRYLQRAIEKRTLSSPEGGDANERAERTRLLRVAADLKEDELWKQRGRFVAIQDFQAAIADLARTTEGRIMEIPSRLASELAGETSRMMVQAKLDKACKDALRLLAQSHRN
jgi:hypothetical protein